MDISNMRDTFNEWLKWGTMFLVARVLVYYVVGHRAGENLFTGSWALNVIFTLLGFALYFMFVRQVLPNKFSGETASDIFDDWVKFGTMLFTVHILTVVCFGGGMFNYDWIINTLFILGGFTAYRIGTKYLEPQGLGEIAQPVVDDVFLFGTMLLVVQLLQQKSLVDMPWLLSSIYMLVGFSVYQIFTRPVAEIVEQITY